MSSVVPKVVFYNGRTCPIIGLGTWLSEPNKVKEAVKSAIACGYRHIDCAYAYQNEDEVGAALSEKMNDGTIKREDVFITSKLWNSFHNPKSVLPVLKKSLDFLKLDYIDLYLMHYPIGFKETESLIPFGPDGKIMFSDDDYVDTWKAMEELLGLGLVKSIGISNFTLEQTKRLLANCTIKPANLQIEVHPLLSQKPLLQFCKSEGITITAYSPLGNPTRPFQRKTDPALMAEAPVVALAQKYNKTPAQILIRYHIENGVMVIPKSVTNERIEMNFQVFDFGLTKEDMQQLDAMNRDLRYCFFPALMPHPDYPFGEQPAWEEK